MTISNWNWCAAPNCRNLIELPYRHCSLACEKACEKRDEAPKPKPKPQTTTVAQAMRELADMRGEYDTDRRIADIVRNAALGVGRRDDFERRNRA